MSPESPRPEEEQASPAPAQQAALGVTGAAVPALATPDLIDAVLKAAAEISHRLSRAPAWFVRETAQDAAPDAIRGQAPPIGDPRA